MVILLCFIEGMGYTKQKQKEREKEIITPFTGGAGSSLFTAVLRVQKKKKKGDEFCKRVCNTRPLL